MCVCVCVCVSPTSCFGEECCEDFEEVVSLNGSSKFGKWTSMLCMSNPLSLPPKSVFSMRQCVTCNNYCNKQTPFSSCNCSEL